MKQEILKTVQSLSFVSCRMSIRLFHEAGTPKDHLTFRQVQQSFLCGFFVSSLCNSPGKSSFLPKWLTNSIRSLFDAHLSLEVAWCCQEQICLTVMESLAYWERFSMSDSGNSMVALSACLLPSILFCLLHPPNFLPYQKAKAASLFNQ